MITRRIREQAALVCAAAACSKAGSYWIAESSVGPLYDEELIVAGNLARDAFYYVNARVKHQGSRRRWELVSAEAEALLRTGWTP